MYAILYGEKLKVDKRDIQALKLVPGIQFFEKEILYEINN
jgi:hypothetical protein